MPVISSAPTRTNSVFNPSDYQTANAAGGLSQTVADSRYMQKSTGVGSALNIAGEARVGNGNIVLGLDGHINCAGIITTPTELIVTSITNGNIVLTEGKTSCIETEIRNVLRVKSPTTYLTMCSLDNTGYIYGRSLNIYGNATLGSVTVTPSTLTVNSSTGVNNLIFTAGAGITNGITFPDGTIQSTAVQNKASYTSLQLFNSSSGTAGVSTINIPANCNYVSIVGVAGGGSAAANVTTMSGGNVTGGCGGGGGGFNIPYFGIARGNLTVSISPTQTSVSYMSYLIVTAGVGLDGISDSIPTSITITAVGAGGAGGSASFSSGYSYLTGCGAITTTGTTGSAGESTSFVVNNKVGYNPLFIPSTANNTGVYGAGGCPPLYNSAGTSLVTAAVPSLGGAVIITFYINKPI